MLRKQEGQGNAIVKSIIRRVVLKRSYSKRFAQIDVSFHVRTLNRNPRFLTTSRRISTWICMTIDWNSCRLLSRLMMPSNDFYQFVSFWNVYNNRTFYTRIYYLIGMDDYNFISVSKWNLKKTFGSFSFFFNMIKEKEKRTGNFRR